MFSPGGCCCNQPDPCENCELHADEFDREDLGSDYAFTRNNVAVANDGIWTISDERLETTLPHLPSGAKLSLSATAFDSSCTPREAHFTVDVDGKARFRFGSVASVPAELEFNSDDGRLSFFEGDGETHRLSGVSYPLDVRVCIHSAGGHTTFKVYTRGAESDDDWTYRFGYPAKTGGALTPAWHLDSGSLLSIDNLSINQNTDDCPECCKCFLFDCPEQIQVTVSGMLTGSSGPGEVPACSSKRGVFVLDRYPELEDDTVCVYALEGDFGNGKDWMTCRIGIGCGTLDPFCLGDPMINPPTTAAYVLYSNSPAGTGYQMFFLYPFPPPAPATWDGYLPGVDAGYAHGGGGYCFNVNLAIERVPTP